MKKSNNDGREADYRMVRAVMALMTGGEDRCGDTAIAVTVGPEIRELAQTRLLVEMLAAQDKGCIYVEAPKSWAHLRPPRVHVLVPTGDPEARFDVTGRCSFWSSGDDGRFLIVSPESARGYFEIVDGALKHRNGLPPGDLAAGISRAATRLRVTMHGLRNVAAGLEGMSSRTLRTPADIATAFKT